MANEPQCTFHRRDDRLQSSAGVHDEHSSQSVVCTSPSASRVRPSQANGECIETSGAGLRAPSLSLHVFSKRRTGASSAAPPSSVGTGEPVILSTAMIRGLLPVQALPTANVTNCGINCRSLSHPHHEPIGQALSSSACDRGSGTHYPFVHPMRPPAMGAARAAIDTRPPQSPRLPLARFRFRPIRPWSSGTCSCDD